MKQVDGFSRNPQPPVALEYKIQRVEQKHVNIVELSNNWLQVEQEKHSEIQKIMSDIQMKCCQKM